MRVHISCARPHADRILPRMSRYLRDRNEWTLSEGPDPTADFNVFNCYIDWAQRHNGWHETPIGAWFTHYDTQNEQKAAWWDEAAEAMDLRVVGTTMYLPRLEPHGLTRLVKPPVERDRFVPIGKEWGPVAGLSGFTYGDGRKGEDLLKKLVKEPFDVKWIASGRGWPVPITGYPWARMHQFFQKLDIYVCASRIEGGPMTVVEALSCGLRVVAPRGVGFVSDIPDTPELYRFKCGSYKDLRRAFAKAVEDGPPIDRQAARSAANGFSVEGWTEGWARAVEDTLHNIHPVPDLPDWRSKCGMYVVAFGDQSRRCAKRCIRSFKEHMPDVPVMLASTEPLGEEDLFCKRDDVDIGGRLAKLAAYEATPPSWEYVLYLDADTEAVGDLSFIYKTLQQGWEVAICKDMHKYATADMMKRPDNHAEFQETMDTIGNEKVLQYNGGMFAFRRSDRVKRLFESWNEEWQKYAKRDQGALLRALYKNPVRLFVLPNLWNATTRYDLPPGEVALLHHNMEARRWGGLIYGRTDSDKAWKAVEQWEKKHGKLSPAQLGE